jgi:ABC-type amino acid transport substrate-binding protein
MTVVVSFRPELEARLREAAAVSGKDVPTLVQEAVEEKLSAAAQPKLVPDVSYQQWAEKFNAWMSEVKERAATYPPGYVADDSRESIYEDRGE